MFCRATLGFTLVELIVATAILVVLTGMVANALMLYQQGKFDAAADEYRAVLSADPKNSDAYAGLTRTLLKNAKGWVQASSARYQLGTLVFH